MLPEVPMATAASPLPPPSSTALGWWTGASVTWTGRWLTAAGPPVAGSQARGKVAMVILDNLGVHLVTPTADGRLTDPVADADRWHARSPQPRCCRRSAASSHPTSTHLS